MLKLQGSEELSSMERVFHCSRWSVNLFLGKNCLLFVFLKALFQDIQDLCRGVLSSLKKDLQRPFTFISTLYCKFFFGPTNKEQCDFHPSRIVKEFSIMSTQYDRRSEDRFWVICCYFNHLSGQL